MRLLLLTLICLMTGKIFSQENYTLKIHGDAYQQFYKKKNKQIQNQAKAKSILLDIQEKAISKGYLLASFDSIRTQEKQIEAYFYLGDQLKNIVIEVKPEDAKFIKKNTRFSEKYFSKIPFLPKELSLLMNQLNEDMLSNGYPFAKVYLSNINYEKTNVYAQLNCDEGNLYYWKAIHIKGDSSIKTNTISSLIGIKKNSIYNESQLKLISGNLKQINYIKEIKPYEILFTEDGAELYLYLQSSPVSSANGVIGLQPNAVTQKMSLTGDIQLKLQNLLHQGELMSLNWRSVQAGTQQLNVSLNYPFLFKSPFGIDAQFQLYKRDTTFLETKSLLGVQYLIGKGSYLKGFYSLHTSDLLSGIPNSNTLSSLKTNTYGLSIFNKRIDYLPNPSKGYSLLIESSIGQRKINDQDSISGSKNMVLHLKLNANFYFSIAKRQVLKVDVTFSSFMAPKIYNNELIRFGGLNTLRGFNEDELFATTASVLNIEYRYLTDKNSHAFVYYNQGFYENNAVNYYQDSPFGFGAGFSFGTKLGIFSISYGLGKQFNNPILLRNSKIHFGYIAYF